MAYLRGDAGGLEVRPSLVPAAGQGLFTTRRFVEGEILCVYSGVSFPSLSASSSQDVAKKDYVMGGFGLYSIDAADCPEVLARYINDHADSSRHNAKFVKLKRERRAVVIAIAEIAPNQEVYAF